MSGQSAIIPSNGQSNPIPGVVGFGDAILFRFPQGNLFVVLHLLNGDVVFNERFSFLCV